MLLERDTFGPYLRHQRERRGISLADIAARTKIARSLLEQLERGDLSRWPCGIFRRSFLREYLGTIGLEPDDFMGEVQRLFPDPTVAAPSPSSAASADALRLTLDAPAVLPMVSRSRARRALVDTGVILGTAAVLGSVVGHIPLVAAIVAILYHGVTTACSGWTLPTTVAGGQQLEGADPRGAPEDGRGGPLAVRRADLRRRPQRGRGRTSESGVVRGTHALS